MGNPGPAHPSPSRPGFDSFYTLPEASLTICTKKITIELIHCPRGGESRMPIYEYQCQECGAQFSKMRSMSQADAPLGCEACGGTHVQRLLSRIAAVRRSGNGGGSAGASGCAGCRASNCSTCGG